MLQSFEKSVIDFIQPIDLQGRMSMHYIITMAEYLTRWVEVHPVKDCMAMTTTKSMFENVSGRFGCPKILMNDRGMHFLNETISALTEEFQIYHQQTMP